MPFNKYIKIIAAAALLQVAYGCESKPIAARQSAAPPKADSGVAKAKTTSAATTDEQQFRASFSRFKSAVKAKDKARLKALFNFPLQTSPQWTNDDLRNSTIDPKAGLITGAEFQTLFDEIFTADAIKLIPASGEDDLSEIDKTTTEDYYKKLMPVTDKGSTLFELQKQYTQDNGQETSFGFVFGKVNGTYKAISYYRPWPLKD